MTISLDFLTGKTTDQLKPFGDGGFLVHNEMHDSLSRLFAAANDAGFELALSSAFRSYELQKKIWNEKVQGLRPVLDSNSIPVDISTKTKEEILFLILRWSAIPGGSRHHWGTDVDVFDRKRKPLDYKLQLIPSEYEEGGIFHETTLWLTENMEDFGFFRPYSEDRGGIAPEPWHISYKPLSERFLESFDLEAFSEHLSNSDFLLIDEAKNNIALLYERFIQIAK